MYSSATQNKRNANQEKALTITCMWWWFYTKDWILRADNFKMSQAFINKWFLNSHYQLFIYTLL